MSEVPRNQASQLGEDSITALLLRFSLPATLAMVVNASYNIIDTMYVGRLGSGAIAALSVAFPMQMLMGALGIGTGVGAGSFISRSLGAGNKGDADKAGGQVFLLAFLFGLLMAAIGQLALRPILVLLGATPEIIDQAVSYMSVITNGAVMLFLLQMLNHVIRSQGNAMLPMTAMIASAITNVILDPIFIFTLNMGVRGAAVATVIAKVVGVALQAHYFISKKGVLEIRLLHMKPNLPILRAIYRVGVPTMLIHMSNDLALIMANRMLGTFGFVPIAVRGLIQRLQMFAFMPATGIGQGLIPIIGYNFGARKFERIREAMLKGCGYGMLLTGVCGLAFFAAPRFFLQIFNSDPQLLAIGQVAVRIVVIMFPLMGIQNISMVFFHATGKGLPALFLSILRQIILYIPLIILLQRIFGLHGIWLATPISDFIAFAVTIYMVIREFNRYGIKLFTRPDATPPPCTDEP